MTTSIHINGGEAIISFAGHLDTATSAEANAKINRELDKAGIVEALTVDASRLEYISSSGLRILLSLAKRYKNFRVTDVQPQVYEVLETTGFTKIMRVERAMRVLSIEGCRLIGIGGVGKVYRLDGDTIIKVFREGTTMEEVRREITLSKEAFVLGMPTAISFDVVKVEPQTEGGTECFGLVYELLKSCTLSTFLKQHPNELDKYARKYADLFKQMHEIEVPEGGNVPSALEHERQQIERIRHYFPEKNIDMMLGILNYIPEGNRLLHLDMQSKNIMVQDGELMLIDMGEISYGHPLLDLGHAYSAMVSLVGDYEKTIGMPRELGQQLFHKAMAYYFEEGRRMMEEGRGMMEDGRWKREEVMAKIDVISCIRNFSWLSLSDSFPEAVIEECKATFEERVAKRYDYIMEVCKTMRK